MPDISKIKRDATAEIEGVEVPFIIPGITLRIARSGNPRYRKRLAELAEEYRATAKVVEIPDDAWDKIVQRAGSETVLVGWTGVEEGDPLVTVPYSHEKAFEFLSDPAYADVAAFVARQCNEAESYRLSARKKNLGN